MITNTESIKRVQEEWAGVSKMRARMQMLLAATFAGGAFTAPALGGIVYNLPLLQAYDVLAQALRALRDQGSSPARDTF